MKVTDFGLARTVDDGSLTQSGTIAGTPMYMAPEQASGEAIDCRADLFSLGSVLYAMSVGHPPFRAPTTFAVLKRVVEDTPRPIREIIPELPQWLGDLIGKLHAKKPADRFQSAKEVADLLGYYLAELQNYGHIRAGKKFEPPITKSKSGLPSTDIVDIRRASTRRGLWLKLSAGVLLLAFVVLSLTDATGLTDVSARAIRLFSPAAGPIAKPKQQDVTESADKVTAPPPANAPFDATQARAHQELWANFLDTKTFTTNSIGMKLALIPPGSFLMGSPDNESFRGNIEGPIREVRITRPYAMGVHPVTVGQFKDFVKEQGYRTEAESSGLGGWYCTERSGRWMRTPIGATPVLSSWTTILLSVSPGMTPRRFVSG